MGGSRMKDEADFDLERFIEMFDTAMTSNDARVVNALRQLMMMVVLTSSTEELHSRHSGPLRRLYDDVYNLNNRLGRMEEELNSIRQFERERKHSYYEKSWRDDPYTMTAARQMAQQIDSEVIRNLTKQINTNFVPPKGLFKK